MPRYEVRWYELVERHKVAVIEAGDARETAELIKAGTYDRSTEQMLKVELAFQFPEEPVLLEEEA